jgi:hypothetical protein
VISIPLLQYAPFFSSFSELVLAPCGLLALVFSISPLALPPLLSGDVGYLPPPVSLPVLLGFLYFWGKSQKVAICPFWRLCMSYGYGAEKDQWLATPPHSELACCVFPRVRR